MKAVPVTRGFAAEYRHDGVAFYFFKLRSDGEIAVWFQYLGNKKPFSEPALREEIRRRLCEVPGVDIAADRISGKPRFALSLLSTPAAMRQFKDTWTWALEQIRSMREGPDDALS